MSKDQVDPWRRGRALALAITASLVLVVSSFAIPQSAAACTCGGESEGDVVFIGQVVDDPNPDSIFGRMFDGLAGVYTFAVKAVARGDALDGRVYTSQGYGGCGVTFELGATYEVHAQVVDPDADYLGEPPGVPLVTGDCMRGGLVEPAGLAFVVGSLATTPEGLAIGAVLLAAVGTVVLLTRRRADPGR